MSGAKGTRRRSSAAKERDDAILSAALDLFLEKGIAETRIEEILEASDTSVGSFYYRYESKVELAAVLYLDIIEQFYGESLHDLRRHKTISAKIRGLVQFYLRFMGRRQKEAAYELFGRTPEVILASQPREKILRAKYYETLFGLLEKHADAGELRKLAPEQYYALWLGPAELLVQGTLIRTGYFTRKSDPEFAQILRRSEELLAEQAWLALRAR